VAAATTVATAGFRVQLCQGPPGRCARRAPCQPAAAPM